MSTKERKINQITAINILSTILLHGINFFTTPIISAKLGTGGYGVVSIYDTWQNLISTIFGLQTLSTIAVARTKFKDEYDSYNSSILFLSLCSFIVLSGFSLFFTNSISNFLKLETNVIYFLLANSLGSILVSFLNTKYTYEFKAGRNLFVALLSATIKLSITFVLLKKIPTPRNYYSYIIGSTSSALAIGLFALALVEGYGKKLYDKKYWSFCLSLSIPIVFHSVSTIILSHSDKVMIQQLMSNSDAGIYSFAIGFAGIIGIIWGALNNSWAPFFFEFAKNNDIDNIVSHSKTYNELFFVLCLGFILLSPEVFSVYAPKDFKNGFIFIPFFALSYYFVFIYSLIINYEIFKENTKMIAVVTVISALINIVLNYLMIPKWGALGAIIATVFSRLIQLIAHHLAAKYYIIKDEYPYKVMFFVPYVGILVLACIIIVSGGTTYPFVRWGIGLCLGVYECIRIHNRKTIF